MQLLLSIQLLITKYYSSGFARYKIQLLITKYYSSGFARIDWLSFTGPHDSEAPVGPTLPVTSGAPSQPKTSGSVLPQPWVTNKGCCKVLEGVDLRTQDICVSFCLTS